MDAVFTIVTKNYLPQARTLGDSIKNIHPNLAFHVLLADETEGLIKLTDEKYPVIEVKDIGVSSYRDMAFKYDLVEFCTAIKPFFFEYLFDRFGYEKIIYFDPDIYVYSSLDTIFDLLDDSFILLTPHITQVDLTDRGTKPQDDFLRCGVYNLGFIAFNNSEKSRAVLAWWKTKTREQGYADFSDGLYVDQKWVELIPCFDDEGVCIVRNPGLNVAHWNMHERKLTKKQNSYLVNDQPLVFFHFSGFDPQVPDAVTRPHAKGSVTLQNQAEYQDLFTGYRRRLLENKSDGSAASYAYARFRNGVMIYGYQRRLYRKLTEQQFAFGDPFSTEAKSYYDVLKTNKLLIFDGSTGGEFRKKDVSHAERKLRLLKKAMLFLKKTIRIKNYYLLLKVLNALSRPEEQTFLLETLKLDLPIQFR